MRYHEIATPSDYVGMARNDNRGKDMKPHPPLCYDVFMLAFLLTVVVISITGVMMPGPLFAVTVAKSYKSQFAGLQAAAGHAVIEVPLMLLIYFGMASFFQHETVRLIFSLAGGLMLIWLGIDTFRTRKTVLMLDKSSYNSIMAGVITSGTNPFFLLWWATIGVALIGNSLAFGLTGFILLMIVHWLCDAVWLSFISALVNRTHKLWGKRVQEGLFIGCSLLLFGFAGWFLISGIRLML